MFVCAACQSQYSALHNYPKAVRRLLRAQIQQACKKKQQASHIELSWDTRHDP